MAASMPLLREFRGFAFESTRWPAVATATFGEQSRSRFRVIDELRVARSGLNLLGATGS